MSDTHFAAVVVGALVEEKTAKEFGEKCKPYTADQAIEAFIKSVVSGELRINAKEAQE